MEPCHFILFMLYTLILAFLLLPPVNRHFIVQFSNYMASNFEF